MEEAGARGALAELLGQTELGRVLLKRGWVIVHGVLRPESVIAAREELIGYVKHMRADEGKFINTHGLFQRKGTGGLMIPQRAEANASLGVQLFGEGTECVGSLDAIAYATKKAQGQFRKQQERMWKNHPDVLKAFKQEGEDAPGITTWAHIDQGVVAASKTHTEIDANGAWRTNGGRGHNSMPFETYPDRAADTVQAYVQLSENIPTHGTVVFEGKRGHDALWTDIIETFKSKALAGKKDPRAAPAKPDNFYMLKDPDSMRFLANETVLRQPDVEAGSAIVWLSTTPHGGATRPEGELEVSRTPRF